MKVNVIHFSEIIAPMGICTMEFQIMVLNGNERKQKKDKFELQQKNINGNPFTFNR